MNDLLERLRDDFQDPEARYTYADSVTNAFISAQIRALREDRELTQDELGVLVGTKQSGISRLEKADYSAWKIETLRKLARAFGVRLRISFEEFGSLPGDVAGFTPQKLAPRKFEKDPIFSGIKQTRSASTTRLEWKTGVATPIPTLPTPPIGSREPAEPQTVDENSRFLWRTINERRIA